MDSQQPRLSAAVGAVVDSGYSLPEWHTGVVGWRVVRLGIVGRRPSEAAGVAGSLALLLARAVGITDVDTIVALGVVIGFLPASVTWLVTLLRNHRHEPPGP